MEEMDFNAKGLKQKVTGEKKQHNALLKRLKKTDHATLDRRMVTLHNYYSDKIDCLECANCCKSISPAITNRDIDRIAKYMKRSPSSITEQYMNLDADGDYVFKSQPCPFLQNDNYCTIYAVRPKACREYPHTDRSKQYQILDLTFKNMELCPIVYQVISDLKRDF